MSVQDTSCPRDKFTTCIATVLSDFWTVQAYNSPLYVGKTSYTMIVYGMSPNCMVINYHC